MSKGDFDLFLNWASLMALGLCVMNLLRFKKRGLRAAALAVSAIMFALALQLYRSGVDTSILAGVGVIIIASLVADIVMKTSAAHKNEESPQ